MQLTQIFLPLTATFAVSARQIPPHCRSHENVACTQWTDSSKIVEPAQHLEPRGAIDDLRMKAICKGSFKVDKTKYKERCSSKDGNEKDACMLHGLLDDASPECKKAMLKSLGF